MTARCGAVDLGELFEDPVLNLGRDADSGIHDLEPEDDAVIGSDVIQQRDLGRYAAGLGELDGVGDEVEQDLPESGLVAAEPGWEP